jgi:NADH-quinone oxidoreductase subunit D
MSDQSLNPRAVDDEPRRRPPAGADGRGDPASAEDVDVPAPPGVPGTTDEADPYALPGDAPAEGRVFTASGGDWDEIADEASELGEERIVVNMGPQHPSTHGVLRLILELDGETVTEARCGIGYLHTGIEKTMEYRTWTQGVTLCTRMDYLQPLYQEVAYCMGVERLLGIEDQVPERVHVIRVMLMELNRVSSHIVALATGGMEIGALTVMTIGFRMRERVLKIFELITGLRMNHGFIRPGGLAQDLPPGALDMITDTMPDLYQDIRDVEDLSNENPLVRSRLVDVGYLDLTGCMALGMTGPVLRATGLPHDLRRSQPYCGYEDYEFDVVTWDTCDAYGRFRIRVEEMRQSLRIVEQCVKRLRDMPPGPVMVADRKIAWPAQLTIGGDGMGNSLEHIREIMGQSMEALIHHFKLVTEGFRVPAGQVYSAVESPRGELAAHLVSDGGTRPYRAHFRDPSFVNLQAVAVMCEGGQVADVVVAVASLDPVMGGVDR